MDARVISNKNDPRIHMLLYVFQGNAGVIRIRLPVMVGAALRTYAVEDSRRRLIAPVAADLKSVVSNARPRLLSDAEVRRKPFKSPTVTLSN